MNGTREEGRMTPMDNEEERQGFFIADETALKCMEDHIEKTESESTQEVFMKALSIMKWYFHFEDQHAIIDHETGKVRGTRLEFTKHV